MAPPEIKKNARKRWLTASILGVVVAGLVALYFEIDFNLKDLTQRIAAFNGAIVFSLMAILPVAGFSVAVTYLVAGVKFGPVLGGVAVAGATAVHLLLTHWICQTMLRGPLQRLLKRRGHSLPHVPQGEDAAVAAMAALIPGLPYFSRNYLLALTDVPLRIYFWVCLPIYVVRAYIVVLLGDLGMDVSRRTFIILVSVYVLKLSICAYLLWRIRRRFKLLKEAELAAAATDPVARN